MDEEIAEDSAAENSAAEDSVVAEMEKVVEGMGQPQPKYFEPYRTNSPDRRYRTCISLETQSHHQTYYTAPSLPPFQSTKKCLG